MSSAARTNQTVTSALVDLATYEVLDQYLYGTKDSITYFVYALTKGNWFSQCPTTLKLKSGPVAFGTECTFSISRAGDYLLYTWFRAILPEISTIPSASVAGIPICSPTFTTFTRYTGTAYFFARWTRKVGLYLIKEVSLGHNDMYSQHFYDYQNDAFWEHNLPESKYYGYQVMIGDVAALNTPQVTLPQYVLNVPLKLWFSRDTGVSLPTAALPYNDSTITLNLRPWEQLLMIDVFGVNGQTYPYINTVCPTESNADTYLQTSITNIKLTQGNLWANYALVSNAERQKMACKTRDMAVEVDQYLAPQKVTPGATGNVYDIRFANPIRNLWVVVRNTTVCNDYTNYTDDVPSFVWSGYGTSNPAISFDQGADPIDTITVQYENSQRLADMPADYYAFVQKFYHHRRIPKYFFHLYSYALDSSRFQPDGSTNFSRITNPSVALSFTDRAIAAAGGASAGSYTFNCAAAQTFMTHIFALNWNIVRISGGTLGIPVM